MGLKTVHYQDTYTQTLKTEASVPECLEVIMNGSPGWIKTLLKIRNSLVGFLGLKTEAGSFDLHRLKKGDHIGFLVVEEYQSDLAVFRGDDKHLNFCVIFESHAKIFRCTTEVEFNNIFGRTYFYSILPFHKRIIPAMLRSLV